MIMVSMPVPPDDGFTAAEYRELHLEYPHTELMDGKILMNASPRPWHNVVVHNLTRLLRESSTPQHVVLPEQDVELNDRTVPTPDVIAVKAATFDIDRTPQRHEDVTLAVEVWSPGNSSEERRTKPLRYAAAGIPHFWSVERDRDGVLIRTHDLHADGTYQPTGTHTVRLVVTAPWSMDFDLAQLTALR